MALAVVGCGSTVTPTIGPASNVPTASSASEEPTVAPSSPDTQTATPGTEPTATPTDDSGSPSPSDAAGRCSGNDDNRAFFAQAAIAMSWPVYCAVLPPGWHLDTGNFRLANGGHLDVIYVGPAGAQLAIAEGNVCDGLGTDVDVCAPRDSVIGPAALGDMTGELGRLSNGLVLDVERGANPSWRATGLRIADAQFVALCAAMYRVPADG